MLCWEAEIPWIENYFVSQCGQDKLNGLWKHQIKKKIIASSCWG